METGLKTIEYSDIGYVTFDEDNKKIIFGLKDVDTDNYRTLECNYNKILECSIIEDSTKLKQAIRQDNNIIETENKAKRKYGCLNLHIRIVLDIEENPYYVLEMIDDFSEKWRGNYRKKLKEAYNIYNEIVNCMR